MGATVGELEALAAGAFLVVALDRRNGETLLQPPANLAVNEGGGGAIVGRVRPSPNRRVRFRPTRRGLNLCRGRAAYGISIPSS